MKNEACCFVLTRMTREDVIMFVLENFELEIIRVGDMDAIIVLEESIRGDRPVGVSVGLCNLSHDCGTYQENVYQV